MLRMAYGKKPTELQLEKLIDHVVQQCLLAGVVVATVVADGEHRLIRRDGFGAAAKKFIDAIMASDSSGVQGQTNEAKATRIAALCSTIITYTQPTASLNLAGAFVPPMIAQPEPAAATTGGGAAAAAAAGVAQHGDIGIKKFDGTPYAFEVCGHKPPYFTVKYEDGDQEQMTNEEIAPLLVKRPLFRAVGEGDADVDTSTDDDGDYARRQHMKQRCKLSRQRMCPDERTGGYEQTPIVQPQLVVHPAPDDKARKPIATTEPATSMYGTGSPLFMSSLLSSDVVELNRLFPTPLVLCRQSIHQIPRSDRYTWVSDADGAAVSKDITKDRLPVEARNRVLSASQEGRLVTLDQWRHDADRFARYARLCRLGKDVWKSKALREMTIADLKVVAGERKLSIAKTPYPRGTNSKTSIGKILVSRLGFDIELERSIKVVAAQLARWPPWKQLTPQEYCVRSGILNEYLIHSDHQRILLLDSNLDREIDWAPQIPESVLLEAAYETRLQYEKSEGLKKGHFYFSNSRRFMTDWDHK